MERLQPIQLWPDSLLIKLAATPLLVTSLLASLGYTESGNLKQNVYDGLRTRERMLEPKDTSADEPPPTYGDYQKRREEVLKKKSEE